MNNYVYVIGGHYGDEAKGKIVDIVAKNSKAVVRGSGGSNAGHTIITDGLKYTFHLLPSGVLYPNVINFLGMEMMIEPLKLISEINKLKENGITPKIRIAKQAQIVTDWEIEFDKGSENSKKPIGTTKKGIGPAAEAKYNRFCSIRILDLKSKELDKKIFEVLKIQLPRLIINHPRFMSYNALSLSEINSLSNDSLKNALISYSEEQASFLQSAGEILSEYISENISKEILELDGLIIGEGAQGTWLDPTYGNPPFTTSTPTTASGLSRGLGIEPDKKEVIGVFKAYETRVGEGPFETEIAEKEMIEKEIKEKGKINISKDDELNVSNNLADDFLLGKYLLSKGAEFGSTTGRPRRCGWFNLDEAKNTKIINGLTWITIMKLDVLDFVPKIKVGIASKKGITYKTFEGWMTNTSKFRSFDELPQNAIKYLKFLESEIAPIAMVSVGPGRDETIISDKFRELIKTLSK